MVYFFILNNKVVLNMNEIYNYSDTTESRVTLSILKEESDFEKLKDIWNSLLVKTAHNNIFLTWEWLYSWWEVYKKNLQLNILIIENGNEIKGIAPFYIEKVRFMGLSYNFLKFLGDKEVCSEYLDLILDNQMNDKILVEIHNFLSKDSCWDCIHLVDFNQKSKLLAILEGISNQKKYNMQKTTTTSNHYIILPKSWEVYLSMISNHFRKKFKKNFKHLNQDFIVRFEDITQNKDFDLRYSMKLMMEIHEQRWKSKRKYGVFKRKKFSQFHILVSERLLQRNLLRLFFLFLNDHPVAVRYGFEYMNKYYSYQAGFLPEYQEYSIGTISHFLNIQNSIEKNLTEFDFLRGNLPYKQHYRTEERNNIFVFISKDTLKGKLIFFVFTHRGPFKYWFKNHLPVSIWSRMSTAKYRHTMKN
jgi:CelD/BcsL family acetyltransferase involved in cellulose biosynthesis